MASIVALEYPENVKLIEGATQYWSDVPKVQLNIDWAKFIVPQCSGRTLVVGWLPGRTLQQISQITELHVLQRGIVGAAEIAEQAPTATVWCGDPKALLRHADKFDTVICFSDVSQVLPLESDSRTWQEVSDDVLALGKADATVLFWIENDLGVHRLTSTHNPRAEQSDTSWDPMATFDESRPLTLEQVRQKFPEDKIYHTWAGTQWSVLAESEKVDATMHAAFATRACLTPRLGPDPVYILSTAIRAGRLTDFCSGWLVIRRLRQSVESSLIIAERTGLFELDNSLPEGARTAAIVFAELAAARDMPAVRQFMADWSAQCSTGISDFSLLVAERTETGWNFTPIVESEEQKDTRWEALGTLVSLMRRRDWRILWPSSYTDARILNHLGIMAKIHTVSPARATNLLQPHSDEADPFGSLDVQSLVAAIDRNNEQIRSLRSELALTKAALAKAQDRPGPLRVPRKIFRIIQRNIKSVLKG